MPLPQQLPLVHASILLLLVWITRVEVEGITDDPQCPFGFKIAKTDDLTLCYRRKEPEIFSDLYKDCTHNRFSLELYNKLSIDKSNAVWSEYKSAYPGGPFLDARFTDHIGHVLSSKYEVSYNHQNQSLEVEEELCVVIDPVQGYLAVRCDEKHYRYCFVDPMNSGVEDVVKEKCENLKDSISFSTPIATCLTVLSGNTENRRPGSNATAPVRATWNQAQELCERKGGASLLNRGWRYANDMRLHSYKKKKTYPLGIIMTSDHSLLRYDASGDHTEIPEWEWNFQGPPEGSGLLGAWTGEEWRLVDPSYIFFDVICERTIKPKNVSLHLSVDAENKLILHASDHIDEKDLYCFTDSVLKFPNKVKVRHLSDNNFILTPKSEDGYYWCIYSDPITYKTVESSRTLFIREKDSLVNIYAVKLKSSKSYNNDNIESRIKKWEKNLKEYIYYTTKYIQYMDKLPDETNTEEVLLNFKRSTGGVEIKDDKVTRNVVVKKTFIDGRTVLLHVALYPDMRPVRPGKWAGMQVLHMRPVYYCKEMDTEYGETVPRMPLGEATTVGCVTYKCIGDFNEGVQWSMLAREGCVRSTTQASALFVEDVTLFMPTLRVQTQPRENSGSSEDSLEKKPTPKTTITLCDDTTIETVMTSTPIFTSTTEEVLTASTPIFNETTTEVTATTTTTSTVEPTTTVEPTPIPVEDQLLQVLEDLDRLVNDTVSIENITTVFNQVNTILEVQEELEIPGRLLHLLDQLGSVMKLNGSQTASAVGTNVALLVADAASDRPVQGLRIAARGSDHFTNDSFEIMTHPANSTILDTETTEAVVQLPASVATSTRRISFVVFRTDRAFRSAYSVNSRVLSVNVQNLTAFPKGEVIDIHINPITSNVSRNESRACAYWHFTGQDDRSGYWSQEGCTFIKASAPGLLDTCRCDHLTHFAEILVPRAVFSERNEDVLEMISVIGCCSSILGLSMVGVTAALFRTWRRDFSNKIWLQLCISIFAMSLCFLVVAFAKFDHYDIPCMLVGIALHYSVLASFCWMLVAAVLSYRRLVLVFTREASHKLLRASAFAYGAPCAIVGVLLSVAPHSYKGRFDDMTPSGAFCYPTGLGLWLAVYAPIAAMLLANWILFGLIVRSVFASKRIQRHGDTNEALRCASVSCLLVFLFGLPWIFGLFAYNIGAAYLFTITVTFQGFILFLFFILGNKKTRDMWLNKLKIKQTRKVPVTSSTYTNRSTGYRGAVPPSSLEAKESKPRSLTSSDDSKFS